MLEAINDRFSCRKFQEKQIFKEDLNVILSAGMMAPVGRGRYDDINITVIQNKELLEKINKAAGRSVFYNAPTLIIISAKDDEFHLKEQDCACVAENMILQATDLSLGSIYLNLVIHVISEGDLLKELNLKEGFKPLVGVGIGYIDGEKQLKDHKINVDYI